MNHSVILEQFLASLPSPVTESIYHPGHYLQSSVSKAIVGHATNLDGTFACVPTCEKPALAGARGSKLLTRTGLIYFLLLSRRPETFPFKDAVIKLLSSVSPLPDHTHPAGVGPSPDDILLAMRHYQSVIAIANQELTKCASLLAPFLAISRKPAQIPQAQLGAVDWEALEFELETIAELTVPRHSAAELLAWAKAKALRAPELSESEIISLARQAFDVPTDLSPEEIAKRLAQPALAEVEAEPEAEAWLI